MRRLKTYIVVAIVAGLDTLAFCVYLFNSDSTNRVSPTALAAFSISLPSIALLGWFHSYGISRVAFWAVMAIAAVLHGLLVVATERAALGPFGFAAGVAMIWAASFVVLPRVLHASGSNRRNSVAKFRTIFGGKRHRKDR